MSRKWQRVKRWDAEHLTGALTPVRWVMHAMSSVTLAVILLTFVGIYGALASIPIGLVARIPTVLIIAGSAIAAAIVGGGILIFIVRRMIPETMPGIRFTFSLFLGLAGAAGAFALWYSAAWPALKYDPATGDGFRLFAPFVYAYGGTTLRRLPGFEMSELEFYSWWPLRLVLLIFVLNLLTATVRRIEFNFKNLGVLTVHTGIVVISLGSVYYQALKKEGDSLLRADVPIEMGGPIEAKPVRGFYDNTAVTLWVAQRKMAGSPLWESRPLRGVPRYNDYNLTAAVPEALGPIQRDKVMGSLAGILDKPQRDLDIEVPRSDRIDSMLGKPRIDPDIRFRVVGYAQYAKEGKSLIIADPDSARLIPEEDRTPIRVVDLLSRVPDADGELPNPDSPAFVFTLNPSRPAGRISGGNPLSVEYTIGMSDQRMSDLLATLPERVPYGLVIEIPAAATEDGLVPRVVVEAKPGLRHQIGDTGWAVGVREVLPEPPFPIITEGYQGSSSSVAVVQITSPDGEVFDRYVYHRFPEINQDLLGAQPDGRPSRRDADPSIRVSFVDASKLQLYFNDRPDGEGGTRTDLIIREPGGNARLIQDVGVGRKIVDVVDKIDFRITESYDHAVRVRHPVPVPVSSRDGRLVGTHSESLLAVEVSADEVLSESGRWSTVVWVPYLQYLDTDAGSARTVKMPGGREITLQFGRIWHNFPGFSIQLINFEMIAYDHRGAPRDYQSLVRVSPVTAEAQKRFTSYDHVTKLNAPLRAPYIWAEDRGLMSNIARRITSGLNPRQFKLSQSGWDREGWTQTQQMADAGDLPRPFARYTILQVGNNPGIHVIALGGVLMGVGIPWAFYFKPWLVRRERDRLAAAAKAGTPGKQSNHQSRGKAPESPAQPAQQEGTAQPVQQA